MKKILTILILFATISLNAQNRGVIYSQDFENDYSDWTISAGTGETSWLVGRDGSSFYWSIPSHTTYAFANDDYEAGDMSDAWLISPTFDLSNTVYPNLRFEYLNEISLGGISTIKISTNGGTSWTNLQTITAQSYWTTGEVALVNYKYDNVKIAFHFNDEGSDIYGFLVDDIVIENILSHDLAVSDVNPSYAFKNTSLTPSVTIHSYGQSSESSYNVSIVIKDFDDNVLYEHNKDFSHTIATGEDFIAELDDDWTPAENGNYKVTATITVSNDDDISNNTVNQNFLVGYKPATIYTYSEQDNRTGIIPITCGTFQNLEYKGGVDYWFLSCADNINGKIYAIENGSKKVFLIPPNGNVKHIGTITDGSIGNVIGLTHDVINDVVYICDRQSSSSNLYTLNMNTWQVTSVGEISANTIIAIGSDANGNLYGIDNEADQLISINKSTGAGTNIGAIGIDIGWADMGCDRINNEMYVTSYSSTEYGKIGSVDMATGTFTQIGTSSTNYTICAVSGGDLTEYTVDFSVEDGDSNPVHNALLTVETLCGDEILITDNSGATSIDLINGNYLYNVSYNGCATYEGQFTVSDGNITEDIQLSCSSSIDEENSQDISIYPNPTNGIFNLKISDANNLLSSDEGGQSNVIITNITGKIVKQFSIINNQSTKINLQNQPSGIYFFSIQTENKIITKKIIKK